MKYAPRPYQADVTQFVLDNVGAAVLLDMGLGKTVAVLTAIEDLIDRCQIGGVLVFGPLRVVSDTWKDEVAQWDHLKHLRVSRAIGSEKERVAALETPADIYLINYENMNWLAAYLHQSVVAKRWPFDVVVYDESSMMKAHNTSRFKTWKHSAGKFKRRIIMSGTPAPETYANLWSQYYLLDGGERLGRFFTHFRDQHFRNVRSYTWELLDGAAKRIEDKVKGVSICLGSAGRVELPELIVNDVAVTLPPRAREIYTEFEKEMIADIGAAKSLVALSAALKSDKCRQLTSGAVYEDGSERTKWTVIHDAKLDAVVEMVEQMQGQPVIILYEYRHELARLRERWPDAPWIGGGSKGASAILERYKRREMRGQPLIAYAGSIGHGINIQTGGSTLIFMSTPWSSERYQQMVKRLHRHGQLAPAVVVHRLICKKTVDEVVVRKLAGKYRSQTELARALLRSGK
jgi:SNF2 family DNA or RNA helicase